VTLEWRRISTDCAISGPVVRRAGKRGLVQAGVLVDSGRGTDVYKPHDATPTVTATIISIFPQCHLDVSSVAATV
jgi:hypothetical protein